MNYRAHRFGLFSALVHIIVGGAGLLPVAHRLTPPSWEMVGSFLPEWAWWLYPAFWIFTGVVMAKGFHDPVALHFGFWLSSCCFLVWGIAGIHSWIIGAGSNIQGFVVNLYFFSSQWLIAYYVKVGNDVSPVVDALAEQQHQAAYATRGK